MSKMRVSKCILASVGLFVVTLVLASLSYAQAIGPFPPERMNYAGIPYISGGVGLEERNLMTAMAHGYDLKLSFATSPSGKYLSNVGVEIRTTTGEKVFQAVSEGPWMFTRLPAGTYRVSATAEDITIEREIHVTGSGLTQANLFWHESKFCLLNADRLCGG
jgi:hypothetical protein